MQELKANSSKTAEAEPVLEVGAENSDKAGRLRCVCQKYHCEELKCQTDRVGQGG